MTPSLDGIEAQPIPMPANTPAAARTPTAIVRPETLVETLISPPSTRLEREPGMTSMANPARRLFANVPPPGGPVHGPRVKPRRCSRAGRMRCAGRVEPRVADRRGCVSEEVTLVSQASVHAELAKDTLVDR